MTPPSDKDYLLKRIAYLEEVNQWHFYAMEVLSSTTSIFGSTASQREPLTILRNTHDCLGRIIALETTAYYLIEDDASFTLAHCVPDTNGNCLEKEVDALIEDGMFAWALNQNHALMVPENERGTNLILHVIATRTRIRGMFVARPAMDNDKLNEGALNLLSYILFNAAYALESAALYSVMEHQHEAMRELTERQSQVLDHQASHDVLTDLPNRILFLDRLEQFIARPRSKDSMIATILIDLDNFKRINDSLGHKAGDQLIRDIGVELQNEFKSEDLNTHYGIRPGQITLSRLGGDEFGILLDSVRAIDLVARFVQHIVRRIGHEYDVMGHKVFVSCSIGVSLFPHDGVDTETLIRSADAAMYESKQQGHGNYRFATTEIQTRTYQHLIIENELIHALANDEFEVHYQPQIELCTGKVIAAEALIRWQHPERGMQSPLTFIPIAEETGLIEGISAWVARRVCRDISTLRGNGNPVPRVALNISPHQFRADIVESYARVIRESDIEPGMIELELTESTIMQDIDKAMDILRRLHDLGFRLAIDDFGTGYSSLINLKRFPLHTLKIDRSFIKDIPGDADDAAIVTAIAAMAHSLSLEVVAEGVETEEQIAFLHNLGSEIVQGYYYSKPLSFEEYSIYLTKHGTAPSCS